MAALADWFRPDVVDLRQISGGEIEGVLAEEIRAWREEFLWDFRPSAELVQRYVDMGSLSGFALRQNGRVVGYSYYVTEDHKGLVGDLFIGARDSTLEGETMLLRATLDGLRSAGTRIHRIESQLLMLRHASLPLAEAPYAHLMHAFDRVLMVASLNGLRPASARPEGCLLDRWHERRQDEAARLIALCYRGHIDSQINDQYRSVSGARRFVSNIINYPGCGIFQYPASLIALDPASGELRGMVLASKVADDVGHITQICTHPVSRGQGLGRTLLDQSLAALAASGCRIVSLTVTAANRPAVQLYESLGFAVQRRFAAHVWDGL